MTYVVGALGSRPVGKGLGRKAAPGAATREPKGKRHAVDSETREVACGTLDSLRVFEELAWAPDGEWCESCEAVVPFSS